MIRMPTLVPARLDFVTLSLFERVVACRKQSTIHQYFLERRNPNLSVFEYSDDPPWTSTLREPMQSCSHMWTHVVSLQSGYEIVMSACQCCS